MASCAPGPRALLDTLPQNKEVPLIMEKTLYVGIDVASASAVAQLLDPLGASLGKAWDLENTPAGAQELQDRLVKILQENAYQKVLIGMEATAYYDWHLADTLAGSSALAPWHVQVYRLNALRVHRFRKTVQEMDKNDRLDAAYIADFLRIGRGLPRPHTPYDPYVPLKRLTRYRCHLIDSLVRETNHLSMHLFVQYSGWAQQNPMGKFTSATSQALIEDFPDPEVLASRSLEELTSLLVDYGKNRFPDPEAVAGRLQQAVRESYRLRPELARSEHFILANLIRNIRALKDSLKEINHAVAEEMNQFPNTLTTLPGIGPVLSAGILAELGDIHRFKNDDAVAKMAGLVWKRIQTGKFEGEDRRLIPSANKYLRYYLCQAANALRVHDATYRAYYESKYKEVTKHRHKRALVLTARKAVRLVFALLKRGQIYRPEPLGPAPSPEPRPTAAVQPAGR
jgi:transposase